MAERAETGLRGVGARARHLDLALHVGKREERSCRWCLMVPLFLLGCGEREVLSMVSDGSFLALSLPLLGFEIGSFLRGCNWWV